jgi:hypothetical protein
VDTHERETNFEAAFVLGADEEDIQIEEPWETNETTSITDDRFFIHENFNLQQINVSQLNFIHDEGIISDVNVIKEVANVTVMTDPNGHN